MVIGEAFSSLVVETTGGLVFRIGKNRVSPEGYAKEARTLLGEALRISSDLGMRPLMERVLSRREILKA